LQKRSTRAAGQGPFHESVTGVAEITGVSIPKRSLEEVLLDAAQDFDAFYREHAPELDTGSILGPWTELLGEVASCAANLSDCEE
jgi:hypothetical protein